MTRDVCYYPTDPEDGSSPLEGYGEWADPSGLCEHEHCAEGNRIGRQYRAPKGDHMTADDIAALKADRELIRDEYHGLWVQDHGGYVVTVDEGV